MKNCLPVILILFSFAGLQAQSWEIRGSLNKLYTFSSVEKISWNSQHGLTKVHPRLSGESLRSKVFDNLFYGFSGISILRMFNNRHGIQVGFQSLKGSLRYTIETQPKNTFGRVEIGSGRSFSIPTVRINYLYNLIKNKNNQFAIHLNGGVLFPVSGENSGPTGDRISFMSRFLNPNGTGTDSVFIIQENTGTQKPKPFTPYVALGVNANILFAANFSAGIELMSYTGFKNLYSEEFTGKTQEAEFTYKVNILPCFFTAGIYLQYRLK